MRPLYISAALLIALAVPGQDAKRPVLRSHDTVEGPLAGEHHVEDLQVFEDGEVVYVEEVTKAMGGGQPEQVAYKATVGADEMRRLAELLNSREIHFLPKKVSPKTRPIDFFWQKSLEINRPDKTQRVQIENFYPFLNMQGSVYPKALVELECTLEDIKTAATKRTRPKDEDNWCQAVANHGKTLVPRPPRTSVEATQGDCHEDGAQSKIVAGEGWGPVRIGAAAKAVDAFLGEAKSVRRYSNVHIKDYVTKGVQVSFENDSGTVHNVYFYNQQRDSPDFGVFCGQVDKGINWQSSVDDVKRAYGQPTAEYSGSYLGGSWRRLVFAGIDFRFENEKMVRIGIPGN